MFITKESDFHAALSNIYPRLIVAGKPREKVDITEVRMINDNTYKVITSNFGSFIMESFEPDSSGEVYMRVTPLIERWV